MGTITLWHGVIGWVVPALAVFGAAVLLADAQTRMTALVKRHVILALAAAQAKAAPLVVRLRTASQRKPRQEGGA